MRNNSFLAALLWVALSGVSYGQSAPDPYSTDGSPQTAETNICSPQTSLSDPTAGPLLVNLCTATSTALQNLQTTAQQAQSTAQANAGNAQQAISAALGGSGSNQYS